MLNLCKVGKIPILRRFAQNEDIFSTLFSVILAEAPD